MPVVITVGINHDRQSDVGCRTPAATVDAGVFDLASVAGPASHVFVYAAAVAV